MIFLSHPLAPISADYVAASFSLTATACAHASNVSSSFISCAPVFALLGDATTILTQGVTDFIQVPITNPTSRSVVFDIWAINNDPLKSSFRIGGYQSEADQTTNMNVINLEADKYNSNVSWFQVGDSYDRFQWYFANIVSETIPTEMDVKVATGAFTDIVINYGEQMDVIWLGEELDVYDRVNIIIAGETLSGEDFRWEIYAPNIGTITIPFLPGIVQPDFSTGTYFNISLDASNSDVNEDAALNAFVLLHCFEAQCEDVAYFE